MTDKGPTEMPFGLNDRKIPYQQILQSVENYPDFLNSYKTRVLTQKTRTIRLLGRKSPAKIIHTLLGYEVQASYKRIHCPDLVTARYLRLFSELGCHSIKLPYDPTLTAEIIPEFEGMLDALTGKIQKLFPRDASLQHRVIRNVFAVIRRHLRML